MHRFFSYSLFLSVILVGAAACSNEEVAPAAAPFFQVKQDGKAWEPATTITYRAGNAFYLVNTKAVEANQIQELYLGFMVTNLRTPSVRLFSAVWTQQVGKAVNNQFVNVDDPGATGLQITRLDTVQKVLEGRFDATLQRSPVYSAQQERMQLTEGSFRVSYRDTILPAYHTGR